MDCATTSRETSRFQRARHTTDDRVTGRKGSRFTKRYIFGDTKHEYRTMYIPKSELECQCQAQQREKWIREYEIRTQRFRTSTSEHVWMHACGYHGTCASPIDSMREDKMRCERAVSSRDGGVQREIQNHGKQGKSNDDQNNPKEVVRSEVPEWR